MSSIETFEHPSKPSSASLSTITPRLLVVKWRALGGKKYLGLILVPVVLGGILIILTSATNSFQSPDGVFVSKWGTEGEGEGEFHYPYRVAVASDGSVYVADKNNNRIQKFSVGPYPLML